jgi:hypothetical protein
VKRAICHCSLVMVLFLTVPGIRAQAQSPAQPHLGHDTWYEFLLKQFNPTDFNYGSWIEHRRHAFLEATVKNQYFWYAFWITVYSVFLTLAYAKRYIDDRRKMRIHAELMADLHNHDLYSRDQAREAIERYNQHIEHCNRAIEIAESADGRPGWGETGQDSLKAELERMAAQLEATTQDRNKLQEELGQKSLVVADLSTRLDALSKRLNGPGKSASGPREPASTDSPGDGARLVGHINRLQEELYAERQKNKHLKGA